VKSLLLIPLLALACDRPPPLSPLAARAPAHLSETGLDAAGVQPYTPAFPLWSDGADKRRWIWLPPGARIDTANPDEWGFPVGTKLWKEFRVGGRRVETRLLWRLPDGWLAVPYAWRADGRDADLVLDGVRDARGTDHDIPSARACVGCHGGHASFVLGFSAIQLAPSLDAFADRLTVPIPPSPPAPAALGYLHANCGSCHHGNRPPSATWLAPPPSFDAYLRVGDPTASTRIAPIVPALLERMTGRRRRMPPIATKHPDPAGIAALRAWRR